MKELRDHLVKLLDWQEAHVNLANAIGDLPTEYRNRKGEKVPYSVWELLEHLRITQWDILEFSRDPSHQSPDWPDGYWPTEPVKSDQQWQETLEKYYNDLESFKQLIADTNQDLFTPFAHGSGQTLFREVILLADHTAYHTGQIVTVRKILGMGIWS